MDFNSIETNVEGCLPHVIFQHIFQIQVDAIAIHCVDHTLFISPFPCEELAMVIVLIVALHERMRMPRLA